MKIASPLAATALDRELAEEVALCYADPLRFVKLMYPWGRGTLRDHAGPDAWQADVLRWVGEQVRARKFDGHTAVAPIRAAVSSGHGIGKSTIAAWLVNWVMATREDAQGTITANTYQQLESKTWASIQKWTKACLVGHWFTVNASRMYHNLKPESWFCTPQSCREENSEAFAGQHAVGSTSFYIVDEASAIPETIYEVAEGGLTDGEPMIFLFGNCTRSYGTFHRACFGGQRDRWNPRIIDSRESRFANKELISEWAQVYGEDSDFFRVRVRGLPPSASDLQYISSSAVFEAQRRPVLPLEDDPLVCGLDVARGGGDDCVFRFRRGADARSIPPIRIPGEQARDSMRLVTVASDILSRDFDGRQVHTMFVDGTGIGGPIADRLDQMGHRNVYEIQFGSEPPDPKFANMRAYMWGQMRDWLPRGAIDEAPRLEQDLTGPGYHHDKRDRLVLEAKEQMKARGLDSPDDGDALALTFAMSVVPKRKRSPPVEYLNRGSWMGLWLALAVAAPLVLG